MSMIINDIYDDLLLDDEIQELCKMSEELDRDSQRISDMFDTLGVLEQLKENSEECITACESIFKLSSQIKDDSIAYNFLFCNLIAIYEGFVHVTIKTLCDSEYHKNCFLSNIEKLPEDNDLKKIFKKQNFDILLSKTLNHHIKVSNIFRIFGIKLSINERQDKKYDNTISECIGEWIDIRNAWIHRFGYLNKERKNMYRQDFVICYNAINACILDIVESICAYSNEQIGDSK